MIPLSSPTQCTIELTTECRLNCVHCYRCATRADPTELTTEEVLKLLSRFKDVGVMDVLFEGGDPFARRDLFDILEASTPHFVTKLSTSGMLVDRTVAQRIYAAGVSAIFVSVFGSTSELHDEITGVSGSFSQTISAIRELKEAGVRTIMVNVPMRPNLHDVGEYLRLAKSLGIRNVSLIGLYKLGRARKRWNDLYVPPQELEDAFHEVRSSPSLYIDHRYYPHVHNCCTQAYAVTQDGSVIGCPYLREVSYYGNIRESGLREMWSSPAWVAVRYGKVTGKCTSCELYQGNCGGGCRASALQETGDFFASDPLCWKK
jgi:radical SAM protein with 4Fe4S-binding SPASM domain